MELVNSFSQYTEEGKEFSNKVLEALSPLMEEAMSKGANSADMCHIVAGAAHLLAAKGSAYAVLKRMREKEDKATNG